MNLTEIEKIQNYLLEQKSQILNRSQEFLSEQKERVILADEVEDAFNRISESISLSLREKDKRTLFQIERALGKIADGTYGQCELCQSHIEMRRLLIRPFSTLCVDCVEEAETTRLQ